MIYTQKPKTIRVMLTPFRDGLQSSFGGKVKLENYLPAMEYAAKEMGVRHMEFGGGARYQAPFFYLGEDPFETMQKMRDAVGPDVDLQILTRSISGVTLQAQNTEALKLQAKLMKAHGTTWDRNFDYMNDTELLYKTGQPIIESGMHHQACIAMMGLPFKSDKVHTAEFYVGIGKKILDSGMRVDSICMKDASGTTDPKTFYDTAIGMRKIMPPEMPLWAHTHDTASMAVSQYMASIAGGADGVDLSVRPLASGTVQPDVRSMAHALKGTGFELDLDVSKVQMVENLLNEGLADYDFNPVTTMADARVIAFPMPGGAIGPNVHMMVKAGLLDKYGEILAEFPVVVEAGGAWTSVTPGSQQYWLQAFNNVLYGRWKTIEGGYGRAVLGYFGKTPLPSDPAVVKIASEQLKLPPFEGDPLEAAADNIPEAKKALEENKLPVTEKNIFLVISAMVPGKKFETNEGMRLLQGKGKIDVPLKKKEEPKPAEEKAPAMRLAVAPSDMMPMTTRCTVVEGGNSRCFLVTVEPVTAADTPPATAPAAPAPTAVAPAAPPTASGQEVPVYTKFAGSVELVDIKVKAGDTVTKGQVVAAVEAMKANHDIKSPVDGVVASVQARIGDELDASKPILMIAKKG
ncbi:MAG: biotin attachment protein [Desulfobacterales bacterium]|nr:biotin attachment protein [Desulfobacterales bacterium]